MKIKHLASQDKQTIFGLSILSFLMIPFIGMIDYSTGPDITFALIYLISVSVIAWLNDRRATIVLASSLTAIT